MKLGEALEGVTRLGLDTAPLIYFIEQHPRFGPMLSPVFQSMADGSCLGVTTVITLIEVLTLPLERGDLGLAEAYKAALMSGDELLLLPVDRETAELGAALRAKHGLRTPDALQVAAALNVGCEAFLTNDKALQKVDGLRVLVLDDFDD